MSFSYVPFASNRDRVRFHIGDTNADAAIYSDAEINAMIAEAGTWQGAVVMALESIIARLAGTPDFTADWLKVDVASQIEAYRRLLDMKRAEFGLGLLGSEAVHVYRLDSQQAEPPTYEG